MTMTLAQNQYVIRLPVTPETPRFLEPSQVAQQWLNNLQALLAIGNYAQVPDLFHEQSWWRDMLALDWEFHSIHNAAGIKDFLSQNQPRVQLSSFRLQHEGKFQPKLDKPREGLEWISSMFFFETRVGRGTGVLRLTVDPAGVWKAYAVYTSLQELKNAEEPLGPKRADGTIESMPGGLAKGNWVERRKRQVEFQDEEPTTLIVGAGKYPNDSDIMG